MTPLDPTAGRFVSALRTTSERGPAISLLAVLALLIFFPPDLSSAAARGSPDAAEGFPAAVPDSPEVVQDSPDAAELPMDAAQTFLPEVREGPFEPHPEAKKAISRLKSPYCPGLMLEVCPSQEARLLRDSIQMLAMEGWTSEELVDWMLANHGSEWRAVPEARGGGLLAWVIPPAILLLGLALVVFALHRLRVERGPEDPSPEGSTPRDLSPEDQERLQAALEELEATDESVL